MRIICCRRSDAKTREGWWEMTWCPWSTHVRIIDRWSCWVSHLITDDLMMTFSWSCGRDFKWDGGRSKSAWCGEHGRPSNTNTGYSRALCKSLQEEEATIDERGLDVNRGIDVKQVLAPQSQLTIVPCSLNKRRRISSLLKRRSN